MHKKLTAPHLSLFLFLVSFCNIAMAQIIISGIVTDEKTGEVLPYVTVQLKSENRYSRSDENGVFKVYPAKRIANDTLVFSSIGFLPVRVAIELSANDLRIKMKQDVTQLREVKISNRESILGKHNKIGFKPFKGTSTITYRFMKEDDYSYLKRVMIWRKRDRLSGKGKTKFRITIYNSEDNYGPPNGVVYEQILVDDGDKDELTVDLLKYRILLPTNYFFVGVERIEGPKQKNREPWLYTIEAKKYCWIKSFGDDEWKKIYMRPAIVAVVM
jgi:hypothetical protein